MPTSPLWVVTAVHNDGRYIHHHVSTADARDAETHVQEALPEGWSVVEPATCVWDDAPPDVKAVSVDAEVL